MAEPDPLRDAVRLAIRRARDENQMGQKEFAEALGKVLGRPVSRSQVSEWESGAREPRARILVAAAIVAGLPVSEILRENRVGSLLHDLRPDPRGERP